MVMMLKQKETSKILLNLWKAEWDDKCKSSDSQCFFLLSSVILHGLLNSSSFSFPHL